MTKNLFFFKSKGVFVYRPLDLYSYRSKLQNILGPLYLVIISLLFYNLIKARNIN